MYEKIERLRALLEKDHPGITDEGVLHFLVDEALEKLEAEAADRAFHITFRERERKMSHLSLVTDDSLN
ncbi:MAG: hypothetical protein EOP11_04715 [Proteobacteria bacterium]|nr:MAG: hypothetical protein EOP11_04715 [Pseudomonadota bacterium]